MAKRFAIYMPPISWIYIIPDAIPISIENPPLESSLPAHCRSTGIDTLMEAH